jgi:hypothetical protein
LQNIISYENKQLFRQQGKKNFAQFFDKSVFKRLSEKSGFSQRKSRKITPYAFVVGFIECSLKKCCSYSQWAAAIGRISGCCIAKQSLYERLNSGSSEFAGGLLQHALKKQITRVRDLRLFGCFKRVLLQDSTTLSLPDTLAGYFPGNISRGVQKAVARIQCIMEITAMRFVHFSFSGFTCNDQSASGLITTYLGKSDLVIRDLGYFVLNSLKEITGKQAYFLSRLRYNVGVYNQKGEPLILQKLLRKKQIDQWVWIGEKQQLPVRLVMLQLPATQAAERIRKARKDRDKRLNHSKSYYKWLNYAAFVTNVDQDVWTPKQVADAYKVRWQIEIVFKSWKSAFNLQYIVQEPYRNVYRIRTAILLMLLFICLFMQKIYRHYKKVVEKKQGKTISLLKLSRYAAANLIFFFSMNSNQLQKQIARHCCYDERSDRMNMTDLIQFLKN